MVDVGGPNFPKTISTKLGIKLGKLYKKRGLANDLEEGIKKMYQALNATSNIKKIDESTMEINVEHPSKNGHNFCPIGGKYNPSNADIFQENICKPYTLGFFNEINSNFKYKVKIKKCIVADDGKTCNYTLNLIKK